MKKEEKDNKKKPLSKWKVKEGEKNLGKMETQHTRNAKDFSALKREEIEAVSMVTLM